MQQLISGVELVFCLLVRGQALQKAHVGAFYVRAATYTPCRVQLPPAVAGLGLESIKTASASLGVRQAEQNVVLLLQKTRHRLVYLAVLASSQQVPVLLDREEPAFCGLQLLGLGLDARGQRPLPFANCRFGGRFLDLEVLGDHFCGRLLLLGLRGGEMGVGLRSFKGFGL